MRSDAIQQKMTHREEKGVQKELEEKINDLQEQLASITSFDPIEAINLQCDDMIIEVCLTVQSQIQHLNILEAQFVDQIEQHRAKRLQELPFDANAKRLAEFQQEITRLSGRYQELFPGEPQDINLKEPANLEASIKEALGKANELLLRVSCFVSRVKRDALDNTMWFEANHLILDSRDPIGKLKKTIFKTSDQTPKVDATVIKLFKAHSQSVSQLVFINDSMLATSTSPGSTITLWNPESGQKLFEFDNKVESLLRLALLPNGWLASSSKQSIIIWDTRNKKLVRTMEGHQSSVSVLKALPNGFLAILDWSERNAIKILNPMAKENNLVNSFVLAERTFFMGVLSNGFLACFFGARAKLVIVNPYNGQEVKSIASRLHATSMLVLNDDRVAVSFENGRIDFYNLFSEIRSFTSIQTSVSRLKLYHQLPCGLILSSCKGSNMALRDSITGELVQDLPDSDSVLSTPMTASKDGCYLATGDDFGRIRTWSLTYKLI